MLGPDLVLVAVGTCVRVGRHLVVLAQNIGLVQQRKCAGAKIGIARQYCEESRSIICSYGMSEN